MKSVVCILGSPRSGSTVLDALLGSHPQAVSTGELSHLVRDGWRGNEVCACGLAVRNCPQWESVRDAWTAEMGDGAIGEFLSLQRSLERLRRIPGLSLGWRFDHPRRPRYEELTRALYSAIGEVTGREVVIDSSKAPVRALGLSRIAAVPLTVIHLVRDPRAVAWSLAKSFTRDPAGGVQRDRPGTPTWRTALKWQFINAQCELVKHRVPRGRFTRIRYEDLMADPLPTLVQVGRTIGLDLAPVGAAAAAGAPVVIGHPVAGNRLRMSRAVGLRLDEEWRDAMPASERGIVSLLAQPLMRAYGYR